MKHTIIFTLLSLATSVVAQILPSQLEPSQPPLVPKVNNYTGLKTPSVRFDSLRVKVDPAFSMTLFRVFHQSLEKQFNIPAKLFNDAPNLIFKLTEDDPNDESYTINVSGDKIIVTSLSEAGAFNATQTLLQMIQKSNNGWHIRSCIIKDSPRFSYRGLMLDESRHFFGKEHVKSLLDTMAAHKMNVFHWHLTDNEGWRIEIKSYPKLTSVGAWRGEGTAMRTPSRDQVEKGKDTPKYGGFYTQEDIKEIVAYAKARHITIIPEIDVPGHGLAICIAYPEVLPTSDSQSGKGVQGLSGNVLSVVREENYVMLDKIFGEIASLFPNQYIHIGGDEVNHNAWKASPEHRAFMKEKGMKSVSELQNYFMLRMEKILKKHGKTMMGWNEIMHGGNLSNDTAVMAWISVNAGLHAARKGHPTIMTPGPHCYFDMKYPGHSETGHWWAGVVDTKNAYEWNPLFTDKLTASQQKFIKGVQGCLWSEFVLDGDGVDYKFWPRACATAEVGWTDQNQRHWPDFEKRLGLHLDYLDTLGVHYRVKPPQGVLNHGKVTIMPAYPNSVTIYTTDGSDPTEQSTVYSGEAFSPDALVSLRYRTLTHSGRLSKVEKGAKRLPVGSWSPADIKPQQKTVLSFPVTIDSDGLWFADLRRLRGKHDLRIHSASITSGRHTFPAKILPNTILRKNQTLRLKFNNIRLSRARKHALIIVVEGIEGNNTRGLVTFDKSVYQEPAFSVMTNVPHYANQTTANLTDYISDSYYQSNRKIREGDTWTLTFDKPVKTSKIIIPTGKAGTNNDILKSGTLEFTTDGKTWQTGVPFRLGPATLIFDKARSIKALRITATADQESWLILRDPQISM